jgi:hypothetical protein
MGKGQMVQAGLHLEPAVRRIIDKQQEGAAEVAGLWAEILIFRQMMDVFIILVLFKVEQQGIMEEGVLVH